MQVDLPLVVPAEAHPEDDVVDLLRADRRAYRVAGERRLHAVEERVDLVDLVSTTQRPTPESLTLTRHCVSSFAPLTRPTHLGMLPALLDADRSGYTRAEYDRLCRPGGLRFAPARWLLKGPGRLSRGEVTRLARAVAALSRPPRAPSRARSARPAGA